MDEGGRLDLVTIREPHDDVEDVGLNDSRFVLATSPGNVSMSLRARSICR